MCVVSTTKGSLCQFPKAVVIRFHTLGGLKQTVCFLRSWEVEICYSHGFTGQWRGRAMASPGSWSPMVLAGDLCHFWPPQSITPEFAPLSHDLSLGVSLWRADYFKHAF